MSKQCNVLKFDSNKHVGALYFETLKLILEQVGNLDMV